MTKATAVAELPSDQAFTDAQIALNKANGELVAEEQALASETAQHNEQCRLLAAGKSADPQKFRDRMIAIEQRIIGLKPIVAERQAAFDAADRRRAQANNERLQEAADSRAIDLHEKHQAAKRATADAWAAFKRAQAAEQQAGFRFKAGDSA